MTCYVLVLLAVSVFIDGSHIVTVYPRAVKKSSAVASFFVLFFFLFGCFSAKVFVFKRWCIKASVVCERF